MSAKSPSTGGPKGSDGRKFLHWQREISPRFGGLFAAVRLGPYIVLRYCERYNRIYLELSLVPVFLRKGAQPAPTKYDFRCMAMTGSVPHDTCSRALHLHAGTDGAAGVGS